MNIPPVVDINRLAFTIDDLQRVIPASRSQIFADVAAGRLRAVKCGRRTWVLREDLLDFLARLPPREINTSVPEVAAPPSTQATRPAAAQTPSPTPRRDAAPSTADAKEEPRKR
jgi:hypothetical protein